MNPLTLWLLGAGTGGLLGRYGVSPVFSHSLGLDPQKSKRFFTLLGILAGSVPALEAALVNKRLKGYYLGKFNDPAKILTWTLRPHRSYYPGTSGVGFLEKESALRDFWKPTFPVSIAMDEISRSPHPGLIERVKLKQLIAQAGKEQGVGLSGLASPGALFSAATSFAKNTIPPVGAAYLAASLLGAPKKVRRTAIGGALLYGALKTLTKQSSEYVLEKDNSKGFACHYRIRHKDKAVGFATAIQDPSGIIRIIGLYTDPKHRKKGLAKSLLATIAKDYKGKVLYLEAKEFRDKPLKGKKLIEFYEKLGFKRIGRSNKLFKQATIQLKSVDPNGSVAIYYLKPTPPGYDPIKDPVLTGEDLGYVFRYIMPREKEYITKPDPKTYSLGLVTGILGSIALMRLYKRYKKYRKYKEKKKSLNTMSGNNEDVGLYNPMPPLLGALTGIAIVRSGILHKLWDKFKNMNKKT